MTYTQYIRNCTEHDPCCVIVCENDDTGEIMWESHDVDTTDPTSRVNPDHPHEDERDDAPA